MFTPKQEELKIKNSNIKKIGFVRCVNCEEQFICPHAGTREGCRMVETLKEIHWKQKRKS